MKEIINSIRSSAKLQTIATFLLFIAGIVLGPLIEAQIAPALNATTIFITVVILFAAVIAIWNHTRTQIDAIQNNTATLAKAVGQTVQMLPYEEGYRWLKEKTEQSKSEVRVYSKYVFDWQNQKPIYDPVRLQKPERKKVFEETEKLLKRKASTDFKYVRIVEVPSGHSISEVFPHDPPYAQQCVLLAEYGKKEPEFACLRTVNKNFPNNFIVLDRNFLYMEFELYGSQQGEFIAPFVLVMDDPNSDIVQSLVRLHERLEANSYLVTNLDEVN